MDDTQDQTLEGTLLAGAVATVQVEGEPPQLAVYRILGCLGKGSFGEVWEGVQERTGQAVAIKVLRPRLGVDFRLLAHELEKLRAVSEHPHVVTLLDADLEHIPPFFVMPLLKAGSLAAHVGQHPGVDQVVTWLEQMAGALRYMHDKGVLHCDLKPSNVLIDEEGRLRLVDFGQSVHLGKEEGNWGTLGFMAPEQCSEDPPPLPSQLWDVYSLGATVYLLLTGQFPRLPPEAVQELSLLSGTRERLREYRQRLSSSPLVDPRAFNPEVDEDLAMIVMRCCTVNPANRAQGVAAVLTDLERRRQGLPVYSARPWKRSYRVGRWLRREKRVVAALLSLVALLFLTFLWFVTEPDYLVPPPLPAREARRLPPLPAGEDATTLYNYALTRYQANSGLQEEQLRLFPESVRVGEGGGLNFRVTGVPGNLEQARIMRAFAERSDDFLSLLRQAARRPMRAQLLSVKDLQDMEDRLSAAVAVANWEGEQDRALDLLVARAVFMRRYTGGSQIGSGRWRQHLLYPSLRALEEFSLARLSTIQLERSLEVLSALQTEVPEASELLIQEKAYALEFLDEARDLPGWLRPALLLGRSGAKEIVARCLDYQTDLLQTHSYARLWRYREDLNQCLARAVAWDPEQEESALKTFFVSLLHPPRLLALLAMNRATWLGVDPTGRYLVAHRHNYLRLEAARVRLASELFFRRQHSWPGRLEDLTPRLGPVRDPFREGRQPLELAPDGRLRSAGRGLGPMGFPGVYDAEIRVFGP